MSNYINESLLDASPLKKQREEAKSLVGKWEKTGLLDGIEGEFNIGTMAQLLENQARQLIGEGHSKTSPSGGNVSTGATYKGDEEWSGVALPLVRRIFGEIAAQDFVSVQPMNLPSGLVFYLDFAYGTSRMGKTSDASMMGKTGKYSPSGSKSPFPEGGLYGAGAYGYTAATSSTVYPQNADPVQPAQSEINYDADVSGSFNAGKLWKCTIAFTDTDADKLSVRAWNITNTGSLETGGGLLNQFTSITGDEGETGTITFVVSASTQVAALRFGDVEYIKAPTEAARGDFEDTTGNATTDSLKIPEINLSLKSRPIVAKTRKLKAIWTPELAQDLNAYHSVDAEAELTSMLSEYISMEIDLEILDMLISDASTVDYWSAKQGNDFDAGSQTFVNTTFYGTRFEWYQTFVQKVTKVSNEIHRLTLRGGANFVVCSPKISTILESLPGYNSSPGADATVQQYAMGVSKIGAVDGRYSVYKNPYMDENTVLVGYRGSSFLETGAVYAPYVPLIMTPLVYDPSDFTPRKGVMTRYAKKMIRPEFFAKIYVADLDLI